MGTASRPKPARLAEKLLYIRATLGLSQSEMLARLGEADDLSRSGIFAYERGVREPPLPVLLKYARFAGVYVDALIDDEVDLPEELPTDVKTEGITGGRYAGIKVNAPEWESLPAASSTPT